MKDIYRNLEKRINDLGFDNHTFWVSADEAKDVQTNFGCIGIRDIKVETK